jgi:transposase
MTLTTADLTAAGSRGVGAVTAGPARPGHAVRRVFTSAYKLRIIQEHDGLTEHGAKGALLRREGLYQSSINKWRIARDRGLLVSGAADARKNGAPRPESAAGPASVAGSVPSRNERVLASENARLTAELARTKAVLEVVGKATALLEMLSESAG